MKVSQIVKIIESAERMYREGGDASVASDLAALNEFCANHQNMTVTAFAKLIKSTAERE